jgi:hypothetical protein
MSFLVVGTNGNFSTQLQETARIDRSLIIDKSVYGNWENKNYTLISKIASAKEEYDLKYLINTVGIISKNYSNDFIKYWNL